MLVLTRRPGESFLIGDSIEIQIVDVDFDDLETRIAISAIDAEGEEVRLRCTTRGDKAVVLNGELKIEN